MKQVRFIATGLILFLGGMVATAAADETYEARITYNPDQSAVEIYESLDQSIRDACRIQYRKHSTTSLSRRFRLQANCRSHLMDSALEIINMPELTALHDGDTHGSVKLSARQVIRK